MKASGEGLSVTHKSQAWHPALLELSPATATEYLDTAVTILLTFIDLLTRHAYVRTTDRT